MKAGSRANQKAAAVRHRIANSYDAPAVCHDHFDGASHCVECGGRCRLTGTEMAYTALVRAIFFSEALSGAWSAASTQIGRSGVDVTRFRERAKQEAARMRVKDAS